MRTKINWINHLIELFIVIIGISSAFWLNNLASEKKEKSLELQFIRDLRSDLRKDSILLVQNIRTNERKVSTLYQGLQLIQADRKHEHSDSLIQILGQIGNYDFFHSESFTLTSLLQSGDIKLISSDHLKKDFLRLLRYYEQLDWSQKNLLQALDQNYFPMIITKIDMITQTTDDPDFFYSLEIKNYCAFTMNDTNNLLSLYRATLKQVNKLMEEMSVAQI